MGNERERERGVPESDDLGGAAVALPPADGFLTGSAAAMVGSDGTVRCRGGTERQGPGQPRKASPALSGGTVRSDGCECDWGREATQPEAVL